jgi:hypothetical protein
MRAKEIGRVGGRCFQASVPSYVITRNQEDQEDSGIDYELELEVDGRATGVIFKAQVKGVLTARRIQQGDVIAYSGLSVDRARYYVEDVGIATVFVVAEVESEKVWWCPIQGNTDFEERLRRAVDAGHKTMTVHLPVANSLPETMGELLTAVRHSTDLLHVRRTTRLGSRRLARIVEDTELADVADGIQRHHDTLRCERIDRLIRRSDFDAALKEAKKIYESESESIQVRFAAGFNIIRIIGTSAFERKEPRVLERFIEARLEICSQLLGLVRRPGASRQVRLSARFLLRCARLAAHSSVLVGLHMSAEIQNRPQDAFTRGITEAAMAPKAGAVLRELRQAQHLFYLAGEGEYFAQLPYFWGQLALDASLYLLVLRGRGSTEAADRLVAWFDGVARLVAVAAKALEEWDLLGSLAAQFVGLADPRDEAALRARVEPALRLTDLIPEGSFRDAAVRVVRERARGIPHRETTLEDEKRIYRRMAEAHGIDVDDPNDAIGRVVATGIRDLNPERVLRNCVHLFVSPGPVGIPARILGLSTAGSKWLHCTKRCISVMGQSLDGVYTSFRRDYCEGCTHSEPHADDWEWSRKWQADEDLKHRAFRRAASSAFHREA